MIADPLLVQTDPAVMSAARAFQNHIFGIGWETGCCNAMTPRYCAAGLALKSAYDLAHCFFGLGVCGWILFGVQFIRKLIKKCTIGKRSIFEELTTGNRYKCKIKDAEDIMWLRNYKLIKYRAARSMWKVIPDFESEIILKSKKNCNNCKSAQDCISDYPYEVIMKCKHDKFGTVQDFDKFEKR